MMRTADAEKVNAIVNHPEVFKWVHIPGQNYIDVTPLLENPHNIALEDNGVCFIFVKHEIGVYEVHSLAIPERRGKWTWRCAQDAMRFMFLNTDCIEILTKIPESNLAALGLARMAGMSLDFSRENVWTRADGKTEAIGYWALRYPEWVKRDRTLVAYGKKFHQALIAQTGEAHHEDDPAHDRHVGACYSMIMCGQVLKASTLYNRWAKFAGYGEIVVNSYDPVEIDIGDAVLCVRDQKFEVLKCQ